ncbi:MAG: hypothetical protein WAT81_02160 [Candidatus Moraniibacteriota bacterium]
MFDSRRPEINPEIVAIARAKGFRMVDIREVGSTVHGGNPPVVVLNEHGFILDRVPDGDARFGRPKHTGSMVMLSPKKGCVRGLPNPIEFVEWFFDKKVVWSRWSSGGFRI